MPDQTYEDDVRDQAFIADHLARGTLFQHGCHLVARKAG